VGGKLTIRVANRRFEEPLGSLPPGRYVEISVADQGPGMDEAQRLRVFDPLFSTKPSHRHRGLGLTAAHSIVRRHGGDIAVDSGLGRGTRVLVYLPAAGAGGAGDSV
jgi:signal transduction histidine kinase